MSALAPFARAFRALAKGYTAEGLAAEHVGDCQKEEGKDAQAVESYLLAGSLFRHASAHDRAAVDLEEQIANDIARLNGSDDSPPTATDSERNR